MLCAWLQSSAQHKRSNLEYNAELAAVGVDSSKVAIQKLDSLLKLEERRPMKHGRKVEIPVAHIKIKENLLRQVTRNLEKAQARLANPDSSPPDSLKQKSK